MLQLFCQYSVSWKEHAMIVPLCSLNQLTLSFTTWKVLRCNGCVCIGCQTVLGLVLFPHIPASLLPLPNISSVYTWSLYRIKPDINDMRSTLSLMIVWLCETPGCLWHGEVGTMVTAANSVLELYVCVHAPSCLTLCNPIECSLPASSVLGISQARVLEWVAISSSRGSSWPRDGTQVSCIGRWVLYHWATWEALFKLKPVRAYWKRATSTDSKSNLLFQQRINSCHLETSLVSKQPQQSCCSMPVLKDISCGSICICPASLKSV